MKRALIVGGTGGTGVRILDELVGRGYEVVLYHRGAHEVAGATEVEHIHGDPHFLETIERDLAGRRWDLVIATYGRIRLLAQYVAGRTDRLITVSGPGGRRLPGVPARETDGFADPGVTLIERIVETEQTVLRGTEEGHYASTVVRYPMVYGPHSLIPDEWHVIKRVRDGRTRWVLPGGGVAVSNRCATANAAHLIGLVVDRPDVAAGQLYQAGDDRQYSFREWIEMIARVLGHTFEFVEMPWTVFAPAEPDVLRLGADALRAVPQGGGPRRNAFWTNEKARTELGYRDAVRPEDWLARTVEHLLANPPPVDGVGNHLKPEQFDYGVEDRMLAWWDGVLASVPPEAQATVARRHSYPHPKAPGAELEGSGT